MSTALLNHLAWLALSLVAAGSPPATQEETPRTAVLSLTSLGVRPEKPGVDTLCQLIVEIHNRSARPVSELAFTVTLNGEALDVYEAQLFYRELPPGASAEVRLFNFWTTETGREIPPGGELAITVTLEAARYFEIETTEENGEQVETWTPQEPVGGLPISRSLRLKLEPPPV